jgi:large subunit ribosomal protein L6
MSRIAKSPVSLQKGVEVVVKGQAITVKGNKGSLEHAIPKGVEITLADGVLTFVPQTKLSIALAGTTRALVNNMVQGVTQGFEKKLSLVGVGYRAQVQDKVLKLTLGFSHPVNFGIPEDVSIETPSQTDVVIRGVNKQRVGQVAANIRAFRPPEPYKGKGVRYADEVIIMKEAKKK